MVIFTKDRHDPDLNFLQSNDALRKYVFNSLLL